MQNSFNKFYNDYKRRTGIKALIDNKETRVFFKEINDGSLNSIDCKYMFVDYGYCKQGSIIKVNNNYYIATQKEENLNNNNYYEKFTVRQAPHILKIYLNNKLEEIPIFIETFSQDVFENQKIKLLDGNIKVTCQFNNTTKKLDSGMRFIKMQNCWKIETKTSENLGLLYLYCKNSEFSAYDDRENEICDYWKYNVRHNYNMIIDTDNIIIEEGQTKQLVVNVTDTVDNNTTNVINPSIIYTSSNKDIVTITDTGLITGIKEGHTTIKVQFENIEKVINIKVVKPLPMITEYQFKTITLDNAALTTDSINMDNNTSKVLKVTEIEKKLTQGDKVTTETITNPSVAYSSNNSNITIDSNGKIQAIAAGSSIISVSYENVKKDINIKINDVLQLVITGKTSIALNRSTTYTSNLPCIWSVEDLSNDGKVVTPWVSITSQTNTSCSIKVTDKWIFSDNSNKYFNIISCSKDNPNVKAINKIKISPY